MVRMRPECAAEHFERAVAAARRKEAGVVGRDLRRVPQVRSGGRERPVGFIRPAQLRKAQGEHRFGLAPLTTRDAAVNDLSTVFRARAVGD